MPLRTAADVYAEKVRQAKAAPTRTRQRTAEDVYREKVAGQTVEATGTFGEPLRLKFVGGKFAGLERGTDVTAPPITAPIRLPERIRGAVEEHPSFGEAQPIVPQEEMPPGEAPSLTERAEQAGLVPGSVTVLGSLLAEAKKSRKPPIRQTQPSLGAQLGEHIRDEIASLAELEPTKAPKPKGTEGLIGLSFGTMQDIGRMAESPEKIPSTLSEMVGLSQVGRTVGRAVLNPKEIATLEGFGDLGVTALWAVPGAAWLTGKAIQRAAYRHGVEMLAEEGVAEAGRLATSMRGVPFAAKPRGAVPLVDDTVWLDRTGDLWEGVRRVDADSVLNKAKPTTFGGKEITGEITELGGGLGFFAIDTSGIIKSKGTLNLPKFDVPSWWQVKRNTLPLPEGLKRNIFVRYKWNQPPQEGAALNMFTKRYDELLGSIQAFDERMVGTTIERSKAVKPADFEKLLDFQSSDLRHLTRVPGEYRDVVKAMQAEIEQVGERAVEAKLLRPEVFAKRQKTHLRRIYEKTVGRLVGDVNRTTGGMDLGQLYMRGQQVKVVNKEIERYLAEGFEVVKKGERKTLLRRDWTPEERELMGEIKNPFARHALGTTAMNRDIELSNFFRWYTETGQDGWWFGRKGQDGYLRIPMETRAGTPIYGKLAGKYIWEPHARAIMGLVESNSDSWRLYQRGLRMWKGWVTALRFATHGRNMRSNVGFAWVAQGHRAVRGWPRALAEIQNKGPWYWDMVEGGAAGGSYSAVELDQLLAATGKVEAGSQTRLTKLLETPGRAVKGLYRAYHLEDLVPKQDFWIQLRQAGATREEALAALRRHYPDYRMVPPLIEWLSKTGLKPFARFQYTAGSIFGQAATGASGGPAQVRFALMPVAMHILRHVTRQYLERQFPEFKLSAIEDALPNWLKKQGPKDIIAPSSVWLPWTDDKGRLQRINVAYEIPWDDIVDQDYTSVWGRLGISRLLTPDGPMPTVLASLLTNWDSFRDEPIVPEGTTKKEAWARVSQFVYSSIAPPIAPYGYDWRKIWGAILRGEDYRGHGPLYTALELGVGLKTYSVDPKRVGISEYYRLLDMKSQATRDARNALGSRFYGDVERYSRWSFAHARELSADEQLEALKKDFPKLQTWIKEGRKVRKTTTGMKEQEFLRRFTTEQTEQVGRIQ